MSSIYVLFGGLYFFFYLEFYQQEDAGEMKRMVCGVGGVLSKYCM